MMDTTLFCVIIMWIAMFGGLKATESNKLNNYVYSGSNEYNNLNNNTEPRNKSLGKLIR